MQMRWEGIEEEWEDGKQSGFQVKKETSSDRDNINIRWKESMNSEFTRSDSNYFLNITLHFKIMEILVQTNFPYKCMKQTTLKN